MNKFEAYAQQSNDSDEPFSFAEWIDTFKKVIRGPTSKSLIMKKLLKTISKSIAGMSQFKEGDNLLQDRTFAKAWSSLSFAASMHEVAGEKKIRYVYLENFA